VWRENIPTLIGAISQGTLLVQTWSEILNSLEANKGSEATHAAAGMEPGDAPERNPTNNHLSAAPSSTRTSLAVKE